MKLAAHVQNLNDVTVDHLRRAVYPAIKCMTGVDPQRLKERVLPAYEEAGLPKPFIWVRDHTDDNRDEWIRMGKAGAQASVNHSAPRYDAWGELTDVVEGHNEAIVWTLDQMRRVNEFEAELALLWHTHGKRYVGGNWSVGHPDLALWPEYGDALQHMDFLGLHIYGWPEGVDEKDGVPFLWHPWRVFRYEKVRQTILDHNMRLPPILLTEIGWARGVWSSDKGDVGFKVAPDANAFYGWLVSFDAKITADTDIRYAAIFQTGANPDWASFDIVHHFVGNCVADYSRVNALNPVMPPEASGKAISAYELERANLQFTKLPATMKVANREGLVWCDEWSLGDYFFFIGYDSMELVYRLLKLETKTWEVVAQVKL